MRATFFSPHTFPQTAHLSSSLRCGANISVLYKSKQATMRRPCFFEDDHVGLASIASTEAGSSGAPSNSSSNNGSNPFFTRSRKSSSYRSLSSLSSSASSNSNTSSPRSTRFYESRCKEPQLPHFLESCALCKKPLSDNRDIFMYRGDTPFCSEECREEQIEIDEAKEKNWKFTSSMTTIRKEKQSKSTPKKSQNYQMGMKYQIHKKSF